MDGNKHLRFSHRLLAVALAILMVVSLVPGNVFTAWAENKQEVAVTKTGSGTVSYLTNDGESGTLVGTMASTGSLELDLDSQLPAKLSFNAAEGYEISSVTVGTGSVTLSEDNSYTLTSEDFEDLEEGASLAVAVVFAETQPETTYTISAGTLRNVTVSMIDEDDNATSLTAEQSITVTESQLPVTMQLSPSTVGFAIHPVWINDAKSVTPNDELRFELGKDAFDETGKAKISAASSDPNQEYTLQDVSLENCTGTVTVNIVNGGQVTAKTYELEDGADLAIPSSELAAGAVLTLTGDTNSDGTATVSSVKIGGKEKTAASDKTTYSYSLRDADFDAAYKAALSASFTLPEHPAEPGEPTYTISLAVTGSGKVHIQKKDQSQEELLDGAAITEADLPAVLTFTGTVDGDAVNVITSLEINQENQISEANQGQNELTYTLTAADIKNNAVSVKVAFEVPAVIYKLNVPELANFSGTVKYQNAETPDGLSAGDLELTEEQLPATITLTTKDHYLFAGVQLGEDPVENSDGVASVSFQVSNASFDDNHSRTLTVETVLTHTIQVVEVDNNTVTIQCNDVELTDFSTPVVIVDNGKITVIAIAKNDEANNVYYVVHNIVARNKTDVVAQLPQNEQDQARASLTVDSVTEDLTVQISMTRVYHMTSSAEGAVVSAAVKHSDAQDYPEESQTLGTTPLDVLHHDSARITVTPSEEGRIVTGVRVRIGQVEADVENLSFDGTDAFFELEDIAADIVIVSVETAAVYKVTAKQNANGLITMTARGQTVTTASGDAELLVSGNDTVTVKVSANEGYMITAVNVGDGNSNNPVPEDDFSEFTLNNIQNSTVIAATIEKLYKISAGKYANGTVVLKEQNGNQTTISSEGTISLPESRLSGAKLVFTPSSEGDVVYVVSDLTVGESQKRKNDIGTGAVEVDQLKASDFDSNQTMAVQVQFKRLWTVTLNNPTNGMVQAVYSRETLPETVVKTVNAPGSLQVLDGATIEIKATPNDNFYTEKLEVDGSTYTDNDATQTGSTTVYHVVVNTENQTGNDAVTINVVFTQKTTMAEIHFNRDHISPVYQDSTRIVYVFAPDYSGSQVREVRMYDKKNRDIEYLDYEKEDYYWNWAKSIKQSTRIKSLWVYTIGAYGYYITVPDNGLYIIIDTSKPQIELKNEYDQKIFNDDVTIELTATDPADALESHGYSGLKQVYYYLGDDSTTKYTITGPFGDNDLQQTKTASFTLSKSDEPVKVTIIAEDRAGNVSDPTTFTVSFNAAEPTVALSYPETDPEPAVVEGGYYFPAARTATITVTDSKNSWNENGITINGEILTPEDASYPTGYLIGEWTETETETEDGEKQYSYSADVTFCDGSYDLSSITYASKTLNGDLSPVTATQSFDDLDADQKTFVVDTQDPSGKLTIQDAEDWWAELVETLTFGLWKQEITVTAETADAVSGVKRADYFVYYYSSDDDNTRFIYQPETDDTTENLEVPEGVIELGAHFRDNPDSWHSYEEGGVVIDANKRSVVLLRIEDKAGHVIFISTDGLITDTLSVKLNKLDGPETPYTSEQSGVKLYGRDGGSSVDVSVSVKDEGDSGLKYVKYWLATTPTPEEPEQNVETLYSFTPSDPQAIAYSELLHEWSEDDIIQISKAQYNSCKVYVYIKASDNAGNEKVFAPLIVDIDNTDPVIDPLNIVETNGKKKEFTLTITERDEHFDPDLVVIETVPAGYSIKRKGNWSKIEGATPDACKHTATFTMDDDARVVVTIKCTDKAGNASNVVSNEILVDQTAPWAKLTILDNTWDTLLSALTFGLWSNEDSLHVTASYGDETSSITSAKYYLQVFDGSAETESHLDEEALKEVSWISYPNGGFNVPASQRFVCYLRVEDENHNVTYVSSDGVIIETVLEQSDIELTEPEGYVTSAHGKAYGIGEEEALNVHIKVQDDQRAENDKTPTSGIQKVEYVIKMGDVEADEIEEAEWTELYAYEYERETGENPSEENPNGVNTNGGHLVIREYGEVIRDETGALPTYADLKHVWEGDVSVDKATYNSCDTKVFVRVTDNAGNVKTNKLDLDIDYTAPVIAEPVIVETENKQKTMTVTITERDAHFDPDKVELIVEPEDYEITLLQAWEPGPGENQHTATYLLAEDDSVTVTIACTDLAGNRTSYDAVSIIIDKTPPTATISILENSWNKLLETLTFGLWSNADEVTVTAECDDGEKGSGIYSVQYYVDSFTGAENPGALLDVDALKSVAWQTYEGGVTLNPNTRFVFYLRVEDNNKNVTYLCSDGVIVENLLDEDDITLEPVGESVSPDDARVIYGIAGDLSVHVKVRDDQRAEDDLMPTSGIKTVEYSISAPNCEEETGVLYSFEYERKTDEENPDGLNTNGGHLVIKEYGEVIRDEEGALPSYADLAHSWEGDISVDKEAFNSSETVVTVKVTDNAGNVSEKSITLDIDSTAPVINVAYDNNEPYQVLTEEGEENGYFDQPRTATVTITERSNHFNENEVQITITALDAKGDEVLTPEEIRARIVGWTTISGATPDEDQHVATISYDADANYTFDVSYTDDAANEGSVETGESVTPYRFTVDTTDPEGWIKMETGGVWNLLLETLSFGIWRNDDVKLTAEAWDATSPIYELYAYKSDSTKAMTVTELDAVPESEWKLLDPEEGMSVSEDEAFTVYLRLMDYAGHQKYLNTDGIVVDKTLNKEQIVLTPSEPSARGEGNTPIYGIEKDAYVDVKIDDASVNGQPNSGIQKVEYTITAPNCSTESGVLYSFQYEREIGENPSEEYPYGENSNSGHLVITEFGSVIRDETGVIPSYEELTHTWSGRIPVDKSRFNSCDTVVTVKVTDNAGNTAENSVHLDIDYTKPVIEAVEDGNRDSRALEAHYTELRMNVTITERDHHFDPNAATAGIKVYVRNDSGEYVELPSGSGAYTISSWTTVQPAGNSDPDVCQHKAVITFIQDGNYQLKISYTDRATNPSENTIDKKFTVDKTPPTGRLSITQPDARTWDDNEGTLIFDLFSNSNVTVNHSSADATSPVISVSYYVTTNETRLDRSALLDLSENVWTEVPESERAAGSTILTPNNRSTVYLRVIDGAYNITFIGTDGIIVDSVEPDVLTPNVSIQTTAQPVNGIYNGNVPIAVRVTEPAAADGSYSGIKDIRYEIKSLGVVTQAKENSASLLYNYSGTAQKQEDLLKDWNSNSAFTVNANANNSNNVEITVYAEDNAGNIGTGTAIIKIDVTKPTISVSYDNNNGDTSFADGTTDAYFNDNRTATIVITERNFDPNAVFITTTNTDGVLPVLSGWRTEGGSGNEDNTRHIATLSYTADGDYTFDIRCTDLAGNQSEGVDYNGLAPQKFTIDKTLPLIVVDYGRDDPTPLNGNYYNRPRTATITINEHNFETSRIEVALTASVQGVNMTLPVVNGWTNDGNLHTATIVYDADADYSFNITYQDKAGNAAETRPTEEFTIDQTPPEVTLEGIVDKSANGGEDDIGFEITVTDINLSDPDLLVLISGSFYRDGKFVEETVAEIRIDPNNLDSRVTAVENGYRITVEDLPEDGVYTVRCQALDKAGNSYARFKLFDAEGKEYFVDHSSEDQNLVVFSVNRDGSTFTLDAPTFELCQREYVQRVYHDIAIIEINPDEVETVLTLNGKTLTEGVDYQVTEDNEGSWHRYEYRITNLSLFAEEGTYIVNVESLDQAGNPNGSTRQVDLRFTVDQTAPKVVISGLEPSGRYQTDSQLVTLIPTDDGGLLGYLEVCLLDEDGSQIGEPLVKLEGKELLEELANNDGQITFFLSEGVDQIVRIICDDAAYVEAPDENIRYENVIERVTVSTSAFQIFWANRQLRWGSIGGVGGGGALLFFLLLAKKRKKKDEPVVEAGKK